MTKSPLPTPLVSTQSKEATHPRIGLGLGSQLTPSKMASPLVFFQLHWLEHGHQRKLSGHFLAKSHIHKYKNWSISLFIIQWMVLRLHHAFCLVSGINSKFVFKITYLVAVSCNVTYQFCWLRQAFGSGLHAGAVASEDYNACFIILFNLPCTDIFSGKLNVFHYYQTITFT